MQHCFSQLSNVVTITKKRRNNKYVNDNVCILLIQLINRWNINKLKYSLQFKNNQCLFSCVFENNESRDSILVLIIFISYF